MRSSTLTAVAKGGVMTEQSQQANRPEGAAQAPQRILTEFVDTYYAGCAMVASSPVDISLYFGRYSLKDLDTGRPVLVQVFEKQLYMTVDEAERLGQAILRTVQVFRAAQRGELKPGIQGSSGTSPGKTGEGETTPPDLLKV